MDFMIGAFSVILLLFFIFDLGVFCGVLYSHGIDL